MMRGRGRPSSLSTDPSPPPFDPRRPDDLVAGSMVAGRYEILAPLGVGGMSSVWHARDHDLDIDVALKVLHVAPQQASIDTSALRREARLALRITHDNVCRTYHAGQDGDLRFLAMELVRGETLRTHIRRGPLPPAMALDLLIQLAEGLGAAHTKGVIHRDLKPENVLVGHDGRVVILDFGLASFIAREPTCSRALAGTPQYMSPEQLRGQPLDARTDIFSASVIAHEVLSGRHPGGMRRAYAGLITLLLATPAVSAWHVAAPTRPAPDVSDIALLPRERRRSAEDGTQDLAARSSLLQYYDLIGPAPGPEHVRAGMRLLDDALANDPRYAPALLERADLLAVDAYARGLSSTEEQLRLIDQALRIDRRDPRAWIMRCDRMQSAAQGGGRPTDMAIDAAFEACADAQRKAPWSGAVQLSLARLYDMRCQDDWAIFALEKAMQLDPRLAGRALEHQLDLELQHNNLFAAEDISRRLVGIYDEDHALGARSPRIQAGAPPPRAAYLLRAGVLIRLGRLREARAALERELALIGSNPGEWWTEASAIRGLLRVARMQGEPEPEPLRERIAELEQRNLREVKAGADPLLLPGAYRSTDPAAGAALLSRLPTPDTFLTALAHAIFYLMAGDKESARGMLALVPPDPHQRWETECAARVEDALSR